MLDDPHAEVRIGILQAFIGRPYAPALSRLEARIRNTNLEELDLSEKRVLFEAYGQMAGSAETSFLRDLLKGKGGLGRRPSSDTRACAAVALGKISTAEARTALEKALRDRDPVVRTAAMWALQKED
jgi:hypothetical protein